MGSNNWPPSNASSLGERVREGTEGGGGERRKKENKKRHAVQFAVKKQKRSYKRHRKGRVRVRERERERKEAETGINVKKVAGKMR